MYEALTNLIGKLDAACPGKWMHEEGHAGTREDPIPMPWIKYDESVHELINKIYRFVDEHEELNLRHYEDVLAKKGIKWDLTSMKAAPVSELDGTTIMALLVGIVRAERFCDGIILEVVEDGTVVKWLRRLKELDMIWKFEQV